MRILSNNPSEDSFFVEITWDEFRQLAVKYEIDVQEKYAIGSLL